MNKSIVIIFLVVFLLASFFYKKFPKEKNEEFVYQIIDGDTFKLKDGRVVRLIGINAPDDGQYYFEESKNKLKELIHGKKVRLEKDIEEKDNFGRLLKYVFVDNIFVNLELVKNGYAHVLTIYPNVKYLNQLKEAETKAKEKNLGIWKKPYFNCIAILEFHFDAKGDDNLNLNDEFVVFKNICNFSFDLTNWTIKDKSNNTFVFPKFVFNPNSKFTLYSGSGLNSNTEFFWNSKKAIWDNKGDILYLRDNEGYLILKHAY
jgi:endonuclease YncB( thermonuclease family)